jgi:hypothetical protein
MQARACIRCPSLRVDPRTRPRLVEIIANLRDRIDEARTNGWTGEVEGLRTSLNAAGAKLASLDRMEMRPQDATNQIAALGIPEVKPAEHAKRSNRLPTY